MAMMVVVQAFAPGQERNPSDVRRGVVEVPVADVVTQAVDGRGQHEDVHEQVQSGGEQSPPHAQHITEPGNSNHGTDKAEAERHLVEHVVFDVPRVTVERLGVLRLFQVVKHVAELDRPESVEMRAVRISFRLGEGMMFTMNGDPLARAEAGRDPQAEPEDEGNGWMELERLMSGAAV